MARCPFAEQRILPDQAGQPAMRATQVIMHSMAIPGATPEDLIARWSQPGTPLESHFIVGRDGKAYQLIDTGRSADANFHANLRPDGTGAISIETEDNIGPPDTLPWTDAQLATLMRLALWAAEVHGVPRRQCRSPSDPGQGFHTLFGAPSEWTPVAKTCPGTIRIRQWHEVVLPAIEAGHIPQEDDMFEQKDRDQLVAIHQALTVPGTTSPEETVNLLFARVRTVEAAFQPSGAVAQLAAKVDAVKAVVDGLVLGRLEGDLDVTGLLHLEAPVPSPLPVADVELPPG